MSKIQIDSAVLPGAYTPAIVLTFEAPAHTRRQLEGFVQRLVYSPAQASRTASLSADVEQLRGIAERLLVEAEASGRRYLDGTHHLLHAACERLYGSVEAAYVDGGILS